FAVDHSGHAYPQLGYSHMVAPSGYMMRQSYVAPGYPPMYGAAPASTGAGVYNSLPATAPAPSWPQSYSAAPSQQSYNAYYSRADASTPQTSTNSYTPMPPMQSQYHGNTIAIPTSANGYSNAISANKLWRSTKLSSKCFTSATEHEVSPCGATAPVDERLSLALQPSKQSS
ncbi:hypothetical protein KCU86_g24968, partial [Aureobasidium melanogenum]